MNLTERTEKMWPDKDALVLDYPGMCSMLTNNSAIVKTAYGLNDREKSAGLKRYLAVPRAYLEKIRDKGFSEEKIGEFELLLKQAEKRFMTYRPTKRELKAEQKSISEMESCVA